jgi:hypothetical protein
MESTVLTALRGAEYLGSHPRARRRVAPVDVVFTSDGISMMRGSREFGTLPWQHIGALSAASWESVERRITAPRVMLLGLWALVFRKTSRAAHLVVADDDGEWAFAIPGLSPDELREGLDPLQRYVPRSSPSIADR